MKIVRLVLILSAISIFTGCAGPQLEMPKPMSKEEMESFFMPNAQASRIVSVMTNGQAVANILVQTQGIATKETGPKETVARFNEVYAFSPTFIAVHRDDPTTIRFWNLQPDDNHDFMLIDPDGMVLMKVLLPPLKETSFVFTFHKEGLFNFICAMHQPSMSGQILVLPPKTP